MDAPPFSAPTAPLAPSPVYPAPSPETYTYHEDYNTNWGPEQQQAFLQYALQMNGGGSTVAGAVPATNNVEYLCKWLTGGISCNQGFANFDELMDHLGRLHDVRGPASRKLVCQWSSSRGCCGLELRRHAYRRHIGTHVGRSVRCNVCGKSFSRKDSMRAHSKKQHGK